MLLINIHAIIMTDFFPIENNVIIMQKICNKYIFFLSIFQLKLHFMLK